MKVGFIGLGHMGAAMAARLIQAGHEVTVYNRTPGKAQPLLDQGACLAATVADACRGEALLTMLADDNAVEAVVFGEGGVFQSLGQETIHVSMSTISVALSERLAAAHARVGQRFVAAPVMGRPNVAASGNLYILAGGHCRVPAAVYGDGPEDALPERVASHGKSRETERQLSHRLGVGGVE